MGLSLCSAAANGCYDSALLAAVVLCTSLAYWWHPTVGLRRQLDMLASVASLAYQVCYSSHGAGEAARRVYLGLVGVGTLCYLAARLESARRADQNVSSACHVALHICGNASNLLLYDALGRNVLGWQGGRYEGGKLSEIIQILRTSS